MEFQKQFSRVLSFVYRKIRIGKTLDMLIVFLFMIDENDCYIFNVERPLADPATLKKRFDEIFGLDG